MDGDGGGGGCVAEHVYEGIADCEGEILTESFSRNGPDEIVGERLRVGTPALAQLGGAPGGPGFNGATVMVEV